VILRDVLVIVGAVALVATVGAHAHAASHSPDAQPTAGKAAPAPGAKAATAPASTAQRPPRRDATAGSGKPSGSTAAKAAPAAAAATAGAGAAKGAAGAASPDAAEQARTAILAARQAAVANDAERLRRAAAQVPGDHPLAPYVGYWQLRQRLSDPRADATATDSAAAAFVALHGGTLVAELLRRDWLVELGRRQEWARFDRVHAEWTSRDDNAVQCLALQSRLARGEDVAAEARAALLVPRDLGEACNTLLASLASGPFTRADLWRRLEVALEAGSPSATRRAVQLLQPSIDGRRVDRATSRPAATLEAGELPRELALAAMANLARTDPTAAANRLQGKPPASLQPADRAFLWSQVAAAGMRRLAPESLEWTRMASAARPSDDTLVWMARAALRSQDWPLLRGTIERMSEAGQASHTWTYWLGRSYQADPKPESQHRARVLFTSISHRADYYSKLAGEELGMLAMAPKQARPPTAAELAAVAALPGFQRALAFYDLRLRIDGNREWNFQLRSLDDRQLLASAEHARQSGRLDRTIGSADRTRDEHDYTLRFVAPFPELLKPTARSANLDPAWVYGLIRQESRFIQDARSHAGASGLMQLMPATARWVAGKMGMKDFRPGRVNELETNLQLGTYYLRMVLDQLDGSPLLASAAYNAGPGRPRSWRLTLPNPVEGAIFAEIIPFHETRQYVQAVLSNAVWYAAVFSGEPQSLRTLLGTVSPNPSVAPTASTGDPSDPTDAFGVALARARVGTNPIDE
jgi:soluble lytic murein transglycosylase